MPPASKGEVRRGQLITTYGVGAIVAVEDESFMVAGIDRWPVTHPNLHDPRLERVMGVAGFATPPAGEDGQDVPVVRFPEIVWCPSCKKLDRHRFFTSPDDNRCRDCGVNLVPSRFVIACLNGHIADFPFFEWVHRGKKQTGEVSHRLTIEAAGNTASLKSIKIACSCGHSETMEGAFQKTALQGITKCKGVRPWLTQNDPVSCDQLPRTLQRGASNVWFSITQSAISIPPWSEGAHKLLNKHWPVLQHVPEVALQATLAGMNVTSETPYTVDDLVLAVRQRREGAEGAEPWSNEKLRRQEYEALIHGKREVSKDQDFVCEPVASLPKSVSRWFDRVMLVKRLREVRILESFSRITPPAPVADAPLPPIYDVRPNWLPGVEVIGEGVFFRLEGSRLKSWEHLAGIVVRADIIDRNYRRRFERLNLPPDRLITPRLVLLHSLAHALINQWSLDSGYPAASLRERLYVSSAMAGVMVYTASSDSAGSLGGVIAQAEPHRLESTLEDAIQRVAWCSADPVCIESEAAGVDALNLAACHACSLLPEVSCEERNVLLDRGVLVGTPSMPELGYFRELLEEA
jgi:hypothetical protein